MTQLFHSPFTSNGIQIVAEIKPEYADILSSEAVEFIAALTRTFRERRNQLLARRQQRQAELDAGKLPDFLPETREIRESAWTVAETPADLQDRRVEITGPVDRKMVINALNSGAKMFMADFEDASSPTWELMVEGQINVRDANRGSIEFSSPEGKQYKLNQEVATLLVRPRGWHLEEKHILVDGSPIPGAFMDFGLYFFHNIQTQQAKGSGTYFYLPKMESHLEARLWNDVFNFAQDALGVARGSIKATVLIETILGAFEMEEILYELKPHCVGLNCGRWDYIFSFIKRFQKNPEYVLPDRAQITMTTHFMRSYSLLAIKTCHKRNAHAMGGMAAQIPIKNDAAANEAAFAKVRADKEREATDGHDGTWVAHPGLVPVALEIFNQHMPSAHQKHKLRQDVIVSAADLLRLPEGEITEAGLKGNVSVALHYLAAWLGGNGCVPLHNLMEDAATAEIARAQLWQWIRYPKGCLNDERKITVELFRAVLQQELSNLQQQLGDAAYQAGHYALAAQLLEQITCSDEFAEFLTLVAYAHLP